MAIFRQYGLPERMNMDSGSRWGDTPDRPYTPLNVGPRRLGVRCSHRWPYHPQTNGKDGRFHHTLKRDVPHGTVFTDLAGCQSAFDRFRTLYNTERPHEALGLAVPASRYRASPRDYPEHLTPIHYDPTDHVRMVQHGGWLSFKGRNIHIPKPSPATLSRCAQPKPTAYGSPPSSTKQSQPSTSNTA